MPNVELPQAEFKVVLLGDTNTGKTSLVLRFVEGYYREAGRSPTVGASFFLTKRVTVQQMTTCKLLLWDTSGQSQYAKLAKTYYESAAAAILTYDVSQPQSLHRLRMWLDELQANIVGRRLELAIVGCKSDLDESLHAPGLKEEAERLALHANALHMVTSAKTNEGVPELFEGIADRVWQWHRDTSSNGGLPIPVQEGCVPVLSRKKHVRSTSPPSRSATPPPRTPQIESQPVLAPQLELKTIDSDTANESTDDLVVNQSAQMKNGEDLICEGSLLSCTDDPSKGCVIL